MGRGATRQRCALAVIPALPGAQRPEFYGHVSVPQLRGRLLALARKWRTQDATTQTPWLRSQLESCAQELEYICRPSLKAAYSAGGMARMVGECWATIEDHDGSSYRRRVRKRSAKSRLLAAVVVSDLTSLMCELQLWWDREPLRGWSVTGRYRRCESVPGCVGIEIETAVGSPSWWCSDAELGHPAA